ncbi:Tetratricopeptide repeat-containing protein [Pedobacter terrae]|uniref:histidine kinase n=1 Tax=Pedobacter terrae TaxID=405671 RepID=A0A1G7R8N1_9SPHI|nr:tetratricopeptide repeat-containing sensor histidine kinase [Pedobacter terrae]SDG07005.1 Tetratricopeptide repeat-containing protein [Pedobacter terrae]
MKNSLLIAIAILFLACQKKEINKQKVLDADFHKALILHDKGNDSAFFYFNTVAKNSKDSLTIAISYNYMASIQSESSDYFGSLESLALSLKFLNESEDKDYDCLSSTYNELGVNNYNLKNYSSALTYYEKALKFSKDDSFRLRILNNKALVYQKTNKYNLALNIYKKLILKERKNSREYARVLSNIAKTQWLQNSNYNAIPKLLSALKIREDGKDEWGQNASYSHLADYYENTKSDSAFKYAKKMYGIATKLNSPDDRLEALQKLIRISPSRLTKKYFKAYQGISDSIQDIRSAAKNQFAVIRYNSEKNEADYLKAQAENVKKQKDIILRNIGIGTLVACLMIGYMFYRRRQKELKKEKELEVKKTELKYVKKVHDEVANKIYQVMTEVENDPGMDRAEVADQLEIVYNISRNILYQNTNINIKESFFRDVNKMLYAYSSDKVEVVVKGSDEKLWEKVEESTKYEVYFILQNLMTNMAKHSGADCVSIEFTKKNNVISVIYFDNGKGMQGAFKKNGLTNTENRIENISGSITFDTKPDAGLEIKLSFPI